MKNGLWLLLILNQFLFAEINSQKLLLDSEELQEIITAEQIYSYFGPEISSLMSDVPHIKKYSEEENISHEKMQCLCDYIARGRKTAPKELIEDALDEILSYLETTHVVAAEEVECLIQRCEDYCKIFISGEADISVEFSENDDIDVVRGVKTYCTLRVKNLCAYKVRIRGDLSVGQDVTVCGSETICGNLTVFGTITGSCSDPNPEPANLCQAGPVTIGTSNATPLNLVTNGCANIRMIISANGGVTIVEPDGGETGLTIEGGGEIINAGDLEVVAGDVILPQAGSSGLVQLGGGDSASATNVRLYEFGTRNFFAGNGAPNLAVTGTDNVSIGSSANSTLTAANNTIAVGSTSVATSDNAIAIGSADPVFTGAAATASRAIAIGLNATASAAMSIAAGSASGTAGGSGASATNTNAIAIGSANGTVAGPVSSGLSSVALGSADSLGTFAGAVASGNRSIAIGINANAISSGTVAVGSASGTVGGAAPVASNISAIAIGSGHIANPGAVASGISAVAIGGADGASAVVSNFRGALASGARSVAVGVNATSSSAGSIALGSASGVGSAGALASNTSSVAIGGASGAMSGAGASGIASVAIGGASGLVDGAVASGNRSVAIGNGANTAQDDAILLGNAAVTAVRVGIGTATPAAKLHVQGVNGTPVTILNQVNTAIGNAPRWLNPSTSAVAGTPIHYNASNQFFGFTSSERYKTNIRAINTEAEIIYQLNPVLYDPKEGFGEGKDIPGFIAEQVYEVAPNLVVLNGDQQPETIAYNSFHALAIKEIQKQQQQLEEQDALIQQQESIINTLLGLVEQLQTQLNDLEQQ